MTAQRDSLTVPLDLAILIDSLCTRFEEAWRAGQEPKVEGFLERVDRSVVPAVLRELVALEIELCRSAGRTVVLDDYRQRFPIHLTAVEEGWALAERLVVRPPPPPTASY